MTVTMKFYQGNTLSQHPGYLAA